ncbi:asparagine synthase C-terminal domain-containing protein [Pyrobaculum neutrophilum]|uniref:Asparagine synthase n=1 Tax=Pyrobaculum neutrophilum (strain DSM 2338 / JCM 9278 / NBRC 100436 / V24Sta) TaxID=444157 RepID=B1YCF8_PYRNV|nr:asparagine synthase-related protein [Pyrobaculum neutrophilum]ACB39471.1 asparagine synthase [Pyrobaculum neutrophilum V24Sta]
MIVERLAESVARRPCDAIAFSGGLDSTAVALAHVKLGHRPLLVNVQLAESPGTDAPHAVEAARRLGLPLVVRYVPMWEALAAVEEVVKAIKLFNPMEVVNCSVQYIALKLARDLGAGTVCTGDAGDEICVGYSFMLAKPREELARYMDPSRWYFCSFDLAKALGVEVKAPFLEAAQHLLSIPIEEKTKCGLGKCLLRQELGDLGQRRKDPAEVGSGFRALYKALEELGRRAEVDLHLDGPARYLYHIYRRAGLTYPKARRNPCPRCGAELDDKRYCKMCGYYGGG